MLYRDRVTRVLEEKREVFTTGIRQQRAALEHYSAALDQVAHMSRDELEERLADVPAPGALPTAEFERGVVIPFRERWDHGDHARAWALEVLHGATTVAVDGSQLAPSKEYNVPIGLVQVAWFENHHDPDRSYIKDVCIDILTENELAIGDHEEPFFLSEAINQRRFQLEIDRVVDYLVRYPQAGAATAGDHGTSMEERAIVFFDGSLVPSFAGQLRHESRALYVEAIVRAIAASTHYRSPLIGYIDTSYARDLVNMLGHACGMPGEPEIFDAQLLSEYMGPFDRTAAFVCARGGVLNDYRDSQTGKDYSRDVCFVYLKTGVQHPPSRVEFPRWLLDARNACSGPSVTAGRPADGHREPSLLDQVLDLVRAEIIVGTGYPYALEAADATAVLTAADRMAFYRLFHDFAEANGLHLNLTAKMSSKHWRR
jgi:hypothetical protein